jgi:hypothetical protein
LFTNVLQKQQSCLLENTMAIHSIGTSDSQGALVVKPRVAWRMLGCSNTHGYALLAAGELDSFRDGRARKITVASIHRYIARHLAESMGKSGRGRPRKIISAQPVAPVATSQEPHQAEAVSVMPWPT